MIFVSNVSLNIRVVVLSITYGLDTVEFSFKNQIF